jgi:hypothetical protein
MEDAISAIMENNNSMLLNEVSDLFTGGHTLL